VAIQPEDLGTRRPVPASQEGRPGTGRGRPWLIMAALLLGLAGLTASAAGIVMQVLPRRLTPAEQQQVLAWQQLRRWRTQTAGQIFPRTLSYSLPGYTFSGSAKNLTLTARRIGIGRQSSCARGADPAAAQILDKRGCQAILRATYADATRSMLVTVGIAVMPTPDAASGSASALGQGTGDHPGIQSLAFARTIADSFGSSQQQMTVAVAGGPYLVMSAAGYADDRPHVPVATDDYADAEMLSVASGLARAVEAPLGAPLPLPHCPGAPGC
jgi:hypothetical protein